MILFLVVLLSVFTGCAKRGTPEGGPVDEAPPVFIRARPENFSTNFDAREIRIYFDEFVKVTDPQRQIIISPPMDPRPEITPLGTASKSIRIRIQDTLQPNTTYTVNFGRSIVDNNEGNPLEFFTYAFSTGSYIDSLTVTGRVSDALLKLPDPYISVMLYEVNSTYNDSVVYNEVPRYVTNTLDSATTFQLKNLKEGTYQMVGMRDINNNYRFDPETDKIAFRGDYITLPTEEVFDLILFREVVSGKFNKPQLKAQQHLIFGYQGEVSPDSLQIELQNRPPEYQAVFTQDREKDTLHYWYKPALERDSLVFEVTTPYYSDTLVTRLRESDADSLEFSFSPSGAVNFDQEIYVLPSIPLVEVDSTRLRITDKDTVKVPFEGHYELWENRYVLNFNRGEDQTYDILALPGAFTDFFGNVNDTLRGQFRTLSYSDYGNLNITLGNVEDFPVILQLTDKEGKIIAETYSTGETTLDFRHIKPGTYFLRLVYDRNSNREWDTGSFLQRRQPEEVVYFPDPIEVRANWDITQGFILE